MIPLLSPLQLLVKSHFVAGNYLQGDIPVFFRQLHVFDGCADCSLDDVTAAFNERIFLLWDDRMAFMFGMQE